MLTKSKRWGAVMLAVAFMASSGLISWGHVQAAGNADDEVHSSYGDTASEMWVYWRGPDTTVSYGTSTYYNHSVDAQPAAIKPVDIAGPFWQAQLTGLTPGTTYHYQIGYSGPDYTFKTAPTGDFTWDDIGDTGSSYYDPSAANSCNKSWMPQVWQQIANEQPAVVTHGGDISYANECGEPAVHQFWNDIAPIAQQAPIEFAWGNHEYGSPDSTSPSGTPRDSMANYKGRFTMANAQTVPNDKTSLTKNPGCPSPNNSSVNGCLGDDWGSFTAGHVLFISYPEPWPGALTSWQSKAGALMAQAEADPNIYFIVTYGHRPAYSSQAKNAAQPDVTAAINALGDAYSPSARPDGKYVLNVGHHVHGGEVFAPKHGVVNVTDGGGGSEESGIKTPTAGSQWFTNHLEHMQAIMQGNTMTLRFICGPVFALNPGKDACSMGSTLYSTTLTGYQAQAGTPQAQLETSLNDGVSSANVGDQLTFAATAANTTAETTAAGASLSLTLPANESIVDAGGGTVSGNTVSWQLGDLAGGQTVREQVVARLDSGSPGQTLEAIAQLQTNDNACSNKGSVCAASDTDTIPDSLGAGAQYVANQSFETDLTGWKSYNSSGTLARTTAEAYDGSASARVTRTASGSGIAGLNSKVRPVTNTVAGTTYTGSAFIRPGAVGQAFTLQIKEVTSAGKVVGTTTVKLTASSTDWQQITGARSAAGNGNQLIFNLFASNVSSGAWFDTDLLSLTSPQ